MHQIKLLVAAVLALFIFLTTNVSAHGYVISPASRSYQGSLEKNTLGYDAALAKYGRIINEPQSLEYLKGFPGAGPADGHIASANGVIGDTLLDIQTATRWMKTNISTGVNSFTWKYTAYHATAKWHYYMTKPGWNPNQPLKRSDLELIGTILHDSTPPQDNTPHQITIPANRQGYHIILAIWDISNTVNSFYNVIDVNVGPGNGPVAPATPAGLAAQNITSTAARITWTAQSDATAYLVFRNNQPVQEVTGAVFPDQGLTPATTYTYTIQAKGATGLTSAQSAPLIVQTSSATTAEKPTAPAHLHSMGTTVSSVELMWGASIHSQGIKYYEIFRNGTSIGQTSAVEYAATGLTANTEYRFTVKSVSQTNQVSDASNELAIKTSAPTTEKPTTPTNLQATSTTASSVSLMWGASTHSQGIKDYEVYRNSIKIGQTGTTVYTATALTANTEYKFVVKAVSQNDQVSDASNELTVRTSNGNGQTYCGASVYSPATPYPTANTPVLYNCRIWKNKWYANPAELPGTNMVWEEVSVCTEAPNCQNAQPPTYCGARAYEAIKAYTTAGTKVFYNCKTWENKWYANPGETPGQSTTWKWISDCNAGSNCPAAATSAKEEVSLIVTNDNIQLTPRQVQWQISSVQIFNAQGATVYSAKSVVRNSFPIISLPTGLYFVKILFKDGEIATRTILK